MFSETVVKSEHRLASRYCASLEMRSVSPKRELWGRLCFSGERIWRFSVNPKKLLQLGHVSPFLHSNRNVGRDGFGTWEPNGAVLCVSNQGSSPRDVTATQAHAAFPSTTDHVPYNCKSFSLPNDSC